MQNIFLVSKKEDQIHCKDNIYFCITRKDQSVIRTVTKTKIRIEALPMRLMRGHNQMCWVFGYLFCGFFSFFCFAH